MTKTQIGYLKLLGYRDTQEDGAILVHPKINHQIDCYVWKDQRFQDILKEFPRRVRKSAVIEAYKMSISQYE